ncbi:MAG: YchJ family protein [Elusimicrobia bacterium]|nr:YchJ family protein [Elusimicrobiota bacterium]
MASSDCPCGGAKAYAACCGPYLSGAKLAPTAEALMRSRYCAYVRAEIPYLRATLAPEGRESFDDEASRRWATESRWLGLTILKAEGGSTADDRGTVAFVARYVHEGAEREHRELASFRKDPQTGAWWFVEALAPKPAPVMREAPKIGRNEPCPCGSGKKHKKCCGAKA